MRKILYITAFVPGKSGAGENFSRQFINSISVSNQVEIMLFKYSTDADYVVESENVTVLKIFKNSRLIKICNYLMFPFVFPLFSVRFNLYRLLFIRKMIWEKKYSLIIFDFSQTFLFSKFIKGIPVLLNCHDIIAQRYSRIHNGMFIPFAKYSERFVLTNENANIFCLSDKDKQLLIDFYKKESIATSIFLENNVVKSWPVSDGSYFVFFANWSRSDNSDGLKWFLKNVFPYLDNSHNFKIIGPGLDPSIIFLINKYFRIKYLGFLDDPYPVISEARALISPLFSGAGIKVKVVESLACGTNVIGTHISFEGISEIYSKYLTQAKNADDFIFAISNFNSNMNDKNELKELFLKTYSNNNISKWVNEFVCNINGTGVKSWQ